VQLPRVGSTYDAANESFGEIESVKTFSELFIPVSGEVMEINEGLNDNPEMVNESPYDEGLDDQDEDQPITAELDKLLSAAEYDDFIAAAELTTRQ
jgi:glycine cleavage system H protein